jgi:hypothetical protein
MEGVSTREDRNVGGKGIFDETGVMLEDGAELGNIGICEDDVVCRGRWAEAGMLMLVLRSAVW